MLEIIICFYYMINDVLNQNLRPMNERERLNDNLKNEKHITEHKNMRLLFQENLHFLNYSFSY